MQKFSALERAYTIKFQPHLVSKPPSEFLGSPQHFDQWAIADCDKISKAYDTEFSPAKDGENYLLPNPASIAQANEVLAPCLNDQSFAHKAIEVGQNLWSTGAIPGALDDSVETVLTSGNRLRTQLGHYQGAMFYFEGEWF